MKFNNKEEFVFWFELQVKNQKAPVAGSWVAPSTYEAIAKKICTQLPGSIDLPSVYFGWTTFSDYAKRIWDRNYKLLLKRNSYGTAYNTAGNYTQNSSYSYKNDSEKSESGLTTAQIGSAVIKRHNFDNYLNKIQQFSNKIPPIPEIRKFETDGGLFGLGNHYINGEEMNKYTEKVQDLFRAHNTVMLETIQEFRDVYATFNYLDQEYLNGIVQAVNAATKASCGAKAASDQAKAAADKALKNENDIKNDIENLRKLVEKIKSIKEDLSNRISNLETQLHESLINANTNVAKHNPSEDNKNLNGKLILSYAIGATGLVLSICSLLL